MVIRQAVSPFPFHGPLAPDAVVGRDAQAELLLERALAGVPVALLAPRRFGKTSLIGRVAWVLETVHAVDTVRVDLMGLSSYADLAVRFERGLGRLRKGPLRRALEALLAGSELEVSLAPGLGLTARLGKRGAPDPVAALHGMLDVLGRAAADQRVAVFLDEFHDITRVDGGDALLRGHAQQHADRIAWLFAGSEPSMMHALFAQGSRPFFGQAEIVELGRLPGATALEIVTGGFAGTGRDAGEQAARVVAVADGHPQRLMLLADRLWRRVDTGAAATAVDFADALEDARTTTAPAHEQLFVALPASQRSVIRAVSEFGSPWAADAARFLDLSKGTVTSAVRALTSRAILEQAPAGPWRTVDPFLSDWVVRTLHG